MISIRLATKQDHCNIRELFYHSYQYMCKKHGLSELSKVTTREAIENAVMMPCENTRILYHNHTLSGVLAIRDNCIERLFINPDKLKKGLGKKLLTYGVQEIASKGYKFCRLEVLEKNHDAKAFYSCLGWKENKKYTLSMSRKGKVPMVEFIFHLKSPEKNIN